MNTEMDITIFLFSELSELLSLISVKIKSLHFFLFECRVDSLQSRVLFIFMNILNILSYKSQCL